MKNKWREFWYCSDGRFNRVSLIKAVVGIPFLPLAIFAIGPGVLVAWLIGLFIGDSYCAEDEKEDVQAATFLISVVLWAIFLVATGQSAS